MLCMEEKSEDAKRISDIFDEITEADKNLVLGYLSALHDKAISSTKEILKEA